MREEDDDRVGSLRAFILNTLYNQIKTNRFAYEELLHGVEGFDLSYDENE